MFIGTQIKPSHLNLACGTAGERWRDRPPPSFFRGFRTPASEPGVCLVPRLAGTRPRTLTLRFAVGSR
jgi:hypothetical protein